MTPAELHHWMGQQWARDASALRAADAGPFSDHGRTA